jgi:hypothetical protein
MKRRSKTFLGVNGNSTVWKREFKSQGGVWRQQRGEFWERFSPPCPCSRAAFRNSGPVLLFGCHCFFFGRTHNNSTREGLQQGERLTASTVVALQQVARRLPGRGVYWLVAGTRCRNDPQGARATTLLHGLHLQQWRPSLPEARVPRFHPYFWHPLSCTCSSCHTRNFEARHTLPRSLIQPAF